ncbi:MAG: hypothetical protein JEZ06_20205 [Anaerolineaceae bacterium]|nr:hypothetical protein [Anaerolineaceae bacterium]
MNTESKKNRHESGQMMVILVLVTIGLLAFTGLAIDGSLLMLEKRQTQNISDVLAINAASAYCRGEDINVIINSILTNNYGSTDILTDITINQPPLSGPYTGDPDSVEIIMHTTLQGGLVTTVYDQPIENTSRAVAKCTPGVPEAVGGGNAIISLNPNQKAAFTNTGNAQLYVANGGIFVNSKHDEALVLYGSNELYVKADSISIVGGYSIGHNPIVDPPLPTIGVPPMTDPLAAVDPPVYAPGSGTCKTVLESAGSTPVIMHPGWYCSVKITSDADVTLMPGTYYIDDDFTLTAKGDLTANNVNLIFQDGNFRVTGQGDFDATEIFIYLQNGELDLTGKGEMNITPPASGTYKGMTFYQDRNNNNEVKITGQGFSHIEGTFYAPAANIEITGQGEDASYIAQFIADTYKISGKGAISLSYDSGAVYETTSSDSIDLLE